MEISDKKKRHKRALGLPPKSRAIKKTEVMIGCERRAGGEMKKKGPG